jgi:hypothetical protein
LTKIIYFVNSALNFKICAEILQDLDKAQRELSQTLSLLAEKHDAIGEAEQRIRQLKVMDRSS